MTLLVEKRRLTKISVILEIRRSKVCIKLYLELRVLIQWWMDGSNPEGRDKNDSYP